MKAFSFTHPQLVSIIAALTADELARRFGRYTETLTLSRWDETTRIGRGGVGAGPDQQSACAERVDSRRAASAGPVERSSRSTPGGAALPRAASGWCCDKRARRREPRGERARAVAWSGQVATPPPALAARSGARSAAWRGQ